MTPEGLFSPIHNQPAKITIITPHGNLSGRIERDEIIITVIDTRMQQFIRTTKIGTYGLGRSAGLWKFPADKLGHTHAWALTAA